MRRTTQRHMTDREIEMEHQRASLFIERWDNGTNRPRLAALDKCTSGEESLSVPVYGFNTFTPLHNEELRQSFPGASINVETQANNSARFVLELPIWTVVDAADDDGDDNEIDDGGRRRRRHRLAGPRADLFYFLLASTISLSTALYFQLAAAVV
jgi:hypothetical protein